MCLQSRKSVDSSHLRYIIMFFALQRSPRGGIGRRAWFRSMCREVWGFESLRGHQNKKGRMMKIIRPFAFWGSRAKRLRALREGRESLALQGQTGSRDVTESLRGHQNKKGRMMKIIRPFAFWGSRAKRLRALREGRESLALQGQTGSRDVTESLRGHQNKKGRMMKIIRPFAFWGSRAKRLPPPAVRTE